MADVNPLTVAGLIEYLEGLDPETQVLLNHWDTGSYRGYYDDVYVARGTSLAGQVLSLLRENLNTTMHGYKGGDYTYGPFCRVFLAEHGDTGPRLAEYNGELVTVREEW